MNSPLSERLPSKTDPDACRRLRAGSRVLDPLSDFLRPLQYVFPGLTSALQCGFSLGGQLTFDLPEKPNPTRFAIAMTACSFQRATS